MWCVKWKCEWDVDGERKVVRCGVDGVRYFE